MSGRQILSLVLAVVVGLVAVRIIFALLSFAFTFLGWVIWIAVAGGVIYALYRGFNYMLTTGKRLT